MCSSPEKTRALFKRIPSMTQRGATAVELAIVLPLLILVMFGLIEFGLYLFNRQIITNACREGCRYGVVARLPSERRSNEEIASVIREYCEQYLVAFGSAREPDIFLKDPVAPDEEPDLNTQRCVYFGCELDVEVIYDHEFLFLSGFIDPLTIDVHTRMFME